MFSGRAICYWIISLCILSWARLFHALFPLLSFLHFCLELKACDFSSTHFGMSIVFLVHSCFCSHVGDTMDVAFRITRRHNLNAHSDPLNLIIFPPLFLKCSIGVSLRTGYHNSSSILVIVFCNGSHLFQRHAS